MDFSASRSSLLRELNLLQGVVEKKNTVPMLSNVLIETKGQSQVSLTATDLEISLETEISADISRAGSAVVQARKLFDIVRSLPELDIAFSKEENDWVKITCGQSQFRMTGLAKEHFPSTPQPNGSSMRIPAAILHNLINKTAFAITQEESRYALGGALLVLSGTRIEMVATDGHRLSQALCEGDFQFDDIRVIIPKKAVGELVRLTGGSEESLEFTRDDNHLFFKMGSRLFSTRVLSGQFPNYDLVIPKGNNIKIELAVDSLAQTIRRVALMADDRSHGVRFDLETGGLVITSKTADLGEAKDTISLDYNGASVSIGFNAQYVLEFLGVIDGDRTTVELKDEQSPVLFRPFESGGYNYNYVVMPMRIS